MKFTVDREEHRTIKKIVDRADQQLFNGLMSGNERLQLTMDLSATHANGTPLDFAGLLEADMTDFSHDIYGIRVHIDRDTGQLGDCFVPRYAKKQ